VAKTQKRKTTAKTRKQEPPQGFQGYLKHLSNTSTGRFVSSIVMALLIVIPVRIFALQGYHIPSGSMEETLLIGDVLFADKITFGPRIPFTDGVRIPGFRSPKPGDIVIFKSPEADTKGRHVDLIKRCVAVSGQVVEMRKEKLYVDGQPVEEPHAMYEKGYLPTPGTSLPSSLPRPIDDFEPFRVPKGHIFVMGDNRDNSNDSRRLGPIPLKLIVAKARIIYFSWDTKGHNTRTIPEKVAQVWRGKPRLGRIGKIL
jgi:signal peptidase I